jgi:hypothetical protein
MPTMLGEINRMTDANIGIVLQRFKEIYEEHLTKEVGGNFITSHTRKLSEHQAMRIFVDCSKQVMRELCLTGCPYGKIWDCKHDVKS